MLSRQQIQAIIEAQDMLANFSEQPNRNGTSYTHVRAYKYVKVDQFKIWVSLGGMRQVEQMSEEELTQAVKQGFTEKLALKSQNANKE